MALGYGRVLVNLSFMVFASLSMRMRCFLRLFLSGDVRAAVHLNSEISDVM